MDWEESSLCNSFNILMWKANDMSVADWWYQTHIKKWLQFYMCAVKSFFKDRNPCKTLQFITYNLFIAILNYFITDRFLPVCSYLAQDISTWSVRSTNPVISWSHLLKSLYRVFLNREKKDKSLTSINPKTMKSFQIHIGYKDCEHHIHFVKHCMKK